MILKARAFTTDHTPISFPFFWSPPVSVTPLCPPHVVFILLVIFPYIYKHVRSVSSWNKQQNLAYMSILSLWETIQILFLSNILIKTYSTCNLFLLSLCLFLFSFSLFVLISPQWLPKFYLRASLSKYGYNWVPNDKWKRIFKVSLLSISRNLDPDHTFLTNAFSFHRFSEIILILFQPLSYLYYFFFVVNVFALFVPHKPFLLQIQFIKYLRNTFPPPKLLVI